MAANKSTRTRLLLTVSVAGNPPRHTPDCETAIFLQLAILKFITILMAYILHNSFTDSHKTANAAMQLCLQTQSGVTQASVIFVTEVSSTKNHL